MSAKRVAIGLWLIFAATVFQFFFWPVIPRTVDYLESRPQRTAAAESERIWANYKPPVLMAQSIATPGASVMWAKPSGVSVFNPTNGFGISAAYWWSPSYTIPTTNAGTVTLPNLTSLGSSYDLTNKAAQSTWPVRNIASLNSFDTLTFNNGPYLNNLAYSGTAVEEVFLVASITNNASISMFFDGSGTVGSRQVLFQNSALLQVNAGSSGTIAQFTQTNHWMVWDVVFVSGGNHTAYTNGIQTATAAAGTAAAAGFTLASSWDQSLPQSMAFVEAFVFTNANLTTLQRSNAFYYCTNRYKFAVP